MTTRPVRDPSGGIPSVIVGWVTSWSRILRILYLGGSREAIVTGGGESTGQARAADPHRERCLIIYNSNPARSRNQRS